MTTSDTHTNTPTDRVPDRVPIVSHTPPRADAKRSCLSVPPPTGTDTISEPATTVSPTVSLSTCQHPSYNNLCRACEDDLRLAR